MMAPRRSQAYTSNLSIPDTQSYGNGPRSAYSDEKNEAGGVGLFDPVQSANRRKMLSAIKELRSTGVQLDIDLPTIAVIGSQSAGKSSLIEAISGITLPRASGTCTRCPTECHLSYSDQPWKCIVSLARTVDAHGDLFGLQQNEPFGEPIDDKKDVVERIRRAQRAILNPSTVANHFLAGRDEDPPKPELSFSINRVSLEISGRELSDLSFLDLPGLIANGNDADITLIENLVTKEISNPSCLILLTIACETDFQTQGAHRLAKQRDPEGKRTIGVLTKPDRIQKGDEDPWIKCIRNELEPLDNGWFSVKQPNSEELAKGISWAEAREQEKLFFSSKSPWSSVESSYQRKFGTKNLTEHLSVLLCDLIKQRYPEIQQEIQNLLRETERNLGELPSPPSADPVTEVVQMVAAFTRDLAQLVEGIAEGEPLLQTIRPHQYEFRKAIRQTAPDFRPYDFRFNSAVRVGREVYEEPIDYDDIVPPSPQLVGTPPTKIMMFERPISPNFLITQTDYLPAKPSQGNDEISTGLETPSFLSPEEEPHRASSDIDAIYLNQVMKLAYDARTRELPHNYPFIVSKNLITNVTKKWNKPSQIFFEKAFEILTAFVHKMVMKHFGQHSQGGLLQRVMIYVDEILDKCHEDTLNQIKWFLRSEQNVFTINEHYFSDYKEKFLAYYRGLRRGRENSSFMHWLDGNNGHRPNSPVSKIISGFREMGIGNVSAADLPKILPTDPSEPGLQIMADVRAYFQVAYKRFCDNIPMAIDQELLRGLDWGRNVDVVLLQGLGVSGNDSQQICKDLLQEPQGIASRREELTQKRARLEMAKKQLMNML